MGHSSIATTSVYAHGSEKNISNLIDLSLDGVDFSIQFQHHKTKNRNKKTIQMAAVHTCTHIHVHVDQDTRENV